MGRQAHPVHARTSAQLELHPWETASFLELFLEPHSATGFFISRDQGINIIVALHSIPVKTQLTFESF